MGSTGSRPGLALEGASDSAPNPAEPWGTGEHLLAGASGALGSGAPALTEASCWGQEGRLCCKAVPFATVRRLAREQRSPGSEDQPPLCLSGKVHVASVNNFPTAAGLASSAAGYACLGGCPQGDWAGCHSGTPHPGSLQGDPTRGSSHTPGC